MTAIFRANRMRGCMRILVGLPMLASVMACGGGSSATPVILMPSPTPTPTPTQYDPLVISDDPGTPQLYDPSLEYAGQTGWLAYTKLDFDTIPGFPLLHTQMASSADQGLSWCYSNRPNTSARAQITEADGTVLDGIWRYEVPAIVHTPDDAAAPWKLLAHKYFWTPAGDRLFQYGWIVMRSATQPTGPWSAEEPLFGTNIAPQLPFSVRINIADFDPSLASMVIITEPGVLYKDGTVYVSMSGAVSSDGIDRIFLLASDDQGQNWRYVSNLITKDDAQALGNQRFAGSSMVAFQGEIYLLAPPVRNGDAPDGTSVFRFTDITTGQLERTASGTLSEINHIASQPGLSGPLGSGQSDYHEGNLSGVLMPQNDTTGPLFFGIYKTDKDILGN